MSPNPTLYVFCTRRNFHKERARFRFSNTSLLQHKSRRIKKSFGMWGPIHIRNTLDDAFNFGQLFFKKNPRQCMIQWYVIPDISTPRWGTIRQYRFWFLSLSSTNNNTTVDLTLLASVSTPMKRMSAKSVIWLYIHSKFPFYLFLIPFNIHWAKKSQLIHNIDGRTNLQSLILLPSLKLLLNDLTCAYSHHLTLNRSNSPSDSESHSPHSYIKLTNTNY